MNHTVTSSSHTPLNTQLLVNRYRDAYRVASVVISFGTTLKVLGILFGLAVFMGSFALANQVDMSGNGLHGGRLQNIYIIVGGVLGGMLWLVLYVLGVLASCHGQVLRATLDEAVYVCQFLSDDERIESANLKRLP